MKRLLAVIFWSVIAAAFIGPGTVTSAASAGAAHGPALLWALAFSTYACLVLQEAAARLTVTSGANLGQALRMRSGEGGGGVLVLLLVLGAIVLGCAAYEAGNLLGAVAGAGFLLDLPRWALTLAMGGVAAALLAAGSPRLVALLLSVLVAVMGVAFLLTALRLGPDPAALAGGLVRPTVPAGSGLLILALVGTTVVPYNLFLGSGLAGGQGLGELRFGLTVAVVLGGVISMGVLVVGSAVSGPGFDFPALAAVLTERLGGWAAPLFGVGLAAAGLSSAVTAPLAAALTARGLFERSAGEGAAPRWDERSWRFRAVWLGVLAVGVGFGLSDVKPIPAILVAQAANGALLPLVALFLLLAVNDRRLMGDAVNGPLANLLTLPAVAVALVIGLAGVARAVAAAAGLPAPDERFLLALGAAAALLVAWPVGRRLAALRK